MMIFLELSRRFQEFSEHFKMLTDAKVCMKMLESTIRAINIVIMVLFVKELKGFWEKKNPHLDQHKLRNISTSNKKSFAPAHCTEKRPHDKLTSPTMSVIAYYLTHYPHFNNSRVPKLKKAAQKVLVPLKLLQQLTA